MGIRRAWWWSSRCRWALCVAGALLLAFGVRVSVEYDARAHFPKTEPQALAHLFADFSHQPNVGAWAIVEDRSNYTTWIYGVTYECGERCTGYARVTAHAQPRAAMPEHGTIAHHHRIELILQACTRLPILPWPSFCEHTETVAVITNELGAGAHLSAKAHARCSSLSALTGSCGSRLREHVDTHLLRVRSALNERAVRPVRL